MSSKYVEMCIVRIQKESPVLSILIPNIYIYIYTVYEL